MCRKSRRSYDHVGLLSFLMNGTSPNSLGPRRTYFGKCGHAVPVEGVRNPPSIEVQGLARNVEGGAFLLPGEISILSLCKATNDF